MLVFLVLAAGAIVLAGALFGAPAAAMSSASLLLDRDIALRVTPSM